MYLLRRLFSTQSTPEIKTARKNHPAVIGLRERSAQKAREAYDTGDIETRLRNVQISADRENVWRNWMRG